MTQGSKEKVEQIGVLFSEYFTFRFENLDVKRDHV